VFSRTDLADFREDVAATIRQVDHARETSKFPATSGSHCTYCPASSECPLPAHLRNWAGAINSAEQAAEATEWEATMGARVKAVREEIRRWARKNGPVRWGRDQVREFVPTESTSVRKRGRSADWLGLESAVVEAKEFGTPFAIGEWLKSSVSNRFVDRTLTPDELAAETAEQGGSRGEEGAGSLDGAGAGSLDDRFGVDPPF
jgi:hypothetical protein